MNKKKETEMNRFFSVEKQIEFIKEYHLEKIAEEKIKQYEMVIKENSQYPNIYSQEQFQTIINSYKNFKKTDYLLRLIQIIQYVLQKEDVLSLLRVFMERKRDDNEYYGILREYRRKEKSLEDPKRLMSQSQFIYYELMGIIIRENGIKIERMMDLGCGNGKKAEELGGLLGINTSRIVCADIESWFNYNNAKRKKRGLELLKISEKGEIKYDENSVDLITIIHSIHHWDYKTTEDYIMRMRSLHKIVREGGYIAIIEHDVLTKEDACLVDIEHGLFEVVLMGNEKNFYKEYKSKYLNFIELEMIMRKSGFKLKLFKYYDGGFINKKTIPDKTYLTLFQKI